MPLPIVHCGYKIDYVPPDGTMPHTHTVTSEIIQTFDNDGNLLINGQLYKFKKNSLFFIHGQATHLVSPRDINRYNHSIIILNTSEIEKLTLSLKMTREYNKLFTENGGALCTLSPEETIRTDSIFLKIYDILNGGEEMKYARLASLFTELIHIGCGNILTPGAEKNRLSDVIAFISDNAMEKITIDDICEHTHMSKYHLCRVFKENIGMTIGGFIRNRRLSEAKRLLSETDMSVAQIAYRCCFTDSSFFSKTFLKEFGTTPGKYRAKYR